MALMSRNQPSDQARTGQSVLRALVADYRGTMILLALMSFVGALLEAFFLVIVTGVAMALVAGGSVGPVVGITLSINQALVVAGVALVARLVLNLLGNEASARFTARVTTNERQRLAHAYLRSSWATQQAEPAGRLQELLTSFVGRMASTASTLTGVVATSLSLLAFLATGLLIDAVSTLAVLVALTVVGALLGPIRERIRRRSAASAQAGLEFSNAVAELGSLGQEMQTFGVQDHFIARIDELTHRTTATQKRVQVLGSSLSPLYMFLAYAAVLVGVAVLSVTGFSNLGVIGAVMLLMLRSLSYGQQLSGLAGGLSAALPFLAKVQESLDRYVAQAADSGSSIPPNVTPLQASDVGYRYTDDRTALRHVSFEIRRGEVIGVIGPSGAGKSTLAQLLLGLRPPTEGIIRAGGVDVREVERSWWSRRVAFVAQDALLFTGTVAENIRFFREGIGEDALRRAAAEANVLADIEALPHGFDTHLGQRGSQLSGGQRQRLSIARALVGRPELLVLDEPTSALDGLSEALVRETLAGLRGKVTSVIIAHRMSTLDICDRIMVIEGGRLTAFDAPAALQQHSEFYQEALAIAGIS